VGLAVAGLQKPKEEKMKMKILSVKEQANLVLPIWEQDHFL